MKSLTSSRAENGGGLNTCVARGRPTNCPPSGKGAAVRDLLQESLGTEPTFREVVDALGLGVPFRMHLSPDDRTSRFLRLGSDCLPILGVTPEAVLADMTVFANLVLPQEREALLANRASALVGRGPTSVEIRIRKPSGELRWLRMTSTRRAAPQGGWLLDGLMVDITEPKRLAEQLALERQRLEQAIELTNLGVFQWDRDDPDAVLWSDQLYAICGVAPHTPITPNTLFELIHPDDQEAVRTAIDAVMEAPDGGDASVEHRIVRRDGSLRWVLMHMRVEHDAQGLRSVHGTTLDVTSRRDAEEQRRLQMRELAHRAKNGMAVMMAMVQQAARGASSVEELSELILSRLAAMARSQDLATAVEGRPLELSKLLAQVLEPFDLSRFDIDPKLANVTVSDDAVISMALLAHELATNALKYGGLSNATGRVTLSLRSSRDGWAVVEWREQGGPKVAPPQRQGFGSRLIGTVMRGRGGGVTPEFAPDGFVARIEMPAA